MAKRGQSQFDAVRVRSEALAKTKANDKQWWLVDTAIKAFISKYPREWMEFQNQLKAERTKYQLAKEGDLKKASWRNTASFPVVYKPDGSEDSLLPVLNKIIPGLTHKKSVNYQPFLKKYPIFLPGEKF